MQVGQAKTAQDQSDLANAMLGVGLVLMAHFVYSYTKLNSDAESVLHGNPEWKALADQWRADADTMGKIYK